MRDPLESQLTQSFLQLDDKAFSQVPILQKLLTEALNRFKDEHHGSIGTVCTALAFVTGEMILSIGEEPENFKASFLRILNAYIAGGPDGMRTGPSTEKSFIRKFFPWP